MSLTYTLQISLPSPCMLSCLHTEGNHKAAFSLYMGGEVGLNLGIWDYCGY